MTDFYCSRSTMAQFIELIIKKKTTLKAEKAYTSVKIIALLTHGSAQEFSQVCDFTNFFPLFIRYNIHYLYIG